MRSVTIDPARGFDNTVDPRVGPQGAIARVENMRVDKLGRLILRSGYTSLGTVVKTSNTLVPFDLHVLNDTLLALGNVSGGSQTGIRNVFRYSVDDARGDWSVDGDSNSPQVTSQVSELPAADSVDQVYSDNESTALAGAVWVDSAASADGQYLALVREDNDAGADKVIVLSASTGGVENISPTAQVNRNARVLAIGSVFYIFSQDTATNDIAVRTWDSASASSVMSGLTTIATGVSAFPARYSVAPFTGTTDYLLAFPTATGYTMRRFNSANVQQTTTSVVSLANAQVDVQGATTETINVVNIRAVDGAELRTFNAATGVLAVGPTAYGTGLGTVASLVLVFRLPNNLTRVGVMVYTEGAAGSSPVTLDHFIATTAAHVFNGFNPVRRCRPLSRPVVIDGRAFGWCAIGGAAQAPAALMSFPTLFVTGSLSPRPAAVAMQGGVPADVTALADGRFSQTASFGQRLYAGVVGRDPRDRSFRAHVLACSVFTGARRQGAVINRQLALTGGVPVVYDGRVSIEIGYETVPVPVVSGAAGGALTLLGTYTYQLVFRSVAGNGDVSQSAPSVPVTVTLTGAQNATTYAFTTPFSVRGTNTPAFQGMNNYVDTYRTEAGGSIPRLVSTFLCPSGNGPAVTLTLTDLVSDAVQQGGALLYTQGADGSLSGRLSLGLASSCSVLDVSRGKLLLGGLERSNQVQISLESRPGEQIGFANDDLFFISTPVAVTAIVATDDGRRLIFGRRSLRELIGDGPNAAGVGDISEPLELSTTIGAKDWRSVVRCQHGVLFQADDDKLYLLPTGSTVPVEAGEGARETLAAFPVITSACRHENDQLVTFTLQNAAGTDSRILHLDLKTSGMGKNGWQGRWVVDRAAALEGGSFPEIIGESVDITQTIAGTTPTLSVTLLAGARVGDRNVIMVATQGTAGTGSVTTASGFTARTAVTGATGTLQVFERLISNAATLAGLGTTLTFSTTDATGNCVIIKQWLIRGAHASQAIEGTSVALVAGTTYALPTLTPTWGSAKNLWLAAAQNDLAFLDVGNPVIRTYPVGYGGASRAESANVGASGGRSADLAYCSRQFEGTAQSGLTFATPFSGNGTAILVAIRSLAATGTPVRASVGYQGRLVVCTATDVLNVDPAAAGDPGSSVIKGEWESADIFPMGTGGAGRHLMVAVTGELLGFCQLVAFLSYDGGVSWVGQRQFQLTPTFGYSLGKVLRLQWVPKRRKIDGVRLKLVMADEQSAATVGPTRAFALNQVQMWFEDLAGPTRGATSTTLGIGNRR